jgi:radial spoke head protein 4A
MVYWATTSLLNDWVQLPESHPDTLCCAREIKHVFTGNLNCKIDSCPPFPGKERHMLRETLARISHATEICPKGLYEVDEDTNEAKLAEEFAMPGTADLNSLEAWGHKHPILLKAGRCSHVAP